MKQERITAIFCNLELIQSLNAAFLIALKQILEEWPKGMKFQCLGSAFMKIVRKRNTNKHTNINTQT